MLVTLGIVCLLNVVLFGTHRSTEDEDTSNPNRIKAVLRHQVSRQEEGEVKDLKQVQKPLHEVWCAVASGATDRTLSGRDCIDLTKEHGILGWLLATLELIDQLTHEQDTGREGRHAGATGAGGNEGDVAAEKLGVLAQGEALGADLDAAAGVFDHVWYAGRHETNTGGLEDAAFAVLQREKLDRLAGADLGFEKQATATTNTGTPRQYKSRSTRG